MKIITNIKKSSNNKYSLLINDEKYLLYSDVLVDFNLLKSKKITDNEFESLIERNNYYDLYLKMISFLSFKMRTTTEIIDKLKQLNASEYNLHVIIERLKKEGYLDDEKYLNCFINDQVNLTLDGPKKISLKLQKMNFKIDDINRYLNKIEEDIWIEKVKKIIAKKEKANHKLSSKSFKQKLKNDLYLLGYDEKYFLNEVESLNINEQDNYNKEYEKYYKKLSKKYTGKELEYKLKQKMYALGFKNYE